MHTNHIENAIFSQPALNVVTENMPVELLALARWVIWKYEVNEPGRKPRKVPYDPKRENRRASTTDPATWGTFEEATCANLFSADYAGIGFVLNGDGVVGVDLDNCVVNGAPLPEAIALLDQIGASYIEFSPSGKGLRALGYGPQIRGTVGIVDGVVTELYSTGRYLTLTGRTIKSGPLVELPGFSDVAAEISGKSDGITTYEIDPDLMPTATDEQLTDLRSAALYLAKHGHGTDYHDWTATGQAMKSLARGALGEREPEVIEIWLEYCRNCGNFDGNKSAMQKWAQLKGDRTSIGAIFEAAQNFGWINPRKGQQKSTTEFTALVKQCHGDKSRYKLLNGNDLRSRPPIKWVVRDVLPASGLAQIFGPSKSGKSFLCIDLACAISEGREWFGHRVKHSPVVYVVLEGEAGFKQRAGAWETHNRRPLPDGFNLVMQPFNVTTPADVADISAVVPDGAIVFIDTLSRAMPGLDENSGRDMGLILQGAKLIADRCSGLVILVHHTGKDDARGARGHSSLTGALDGSLWVKRVGDMRSWTSDKVKEGPDGESTAFKLLPVTVGMDDDGVAIVSCVVEPGSGVALAALPDLPLKGASLKAFDILKALIDSEGTPAPAGIVRLLFENQTNVVPVLQWRTACYAAGIVKGDSKDDAKRKAFERAISDLSQRGLIDMQGGLAWVCTLNNSDICPDI